MSDDKKWFKVWTSLLIDPDFDSLHNQEIGVWLRLGALVASQGKNGKITISKDQFLKRAHLIKADESVTQGIKKELEKINLFVTESETGNVTVTFKNWSKYQVFSESYDRVKKFRNKQKCNAVETGHKEVEEEVEENKKKILKENTKESFGVFWYDYPKKKGKEVALRAWLKIKPDEVLMEKIMSALKAQKEDPEWVAREGQYIPYPASWLNGKRWEDENNEESNDDYFNSFGDDL